MCFPGPMENSIHGTMTARSFGHATSMVGHVFIPQADVPLVMSSNKYIIIYLGMSSDLSFFHPYEYVATGSILSGTAGHIVSMERWSKRA